VGIVPASADPLTSGTIIDESGLGIQVTNGSLTVTGTNAGDLVNITPVLNADGNAVPGEFTVNGLHVAGVTKDIKLTMKGGGDEVRIGPAIAYEYNGCGFSDCLVKLAGDIRISGDKGEDSIRVIGFEADDLLIKSGSGADWIDVQNGSADDVVIRTQSGEDNLYIEGSTIDNLNVNMAGGGNYMSMYLSTLNRMRIKSGSGSDGVFLGDNFSLGHNPQIISGGSIDSIDLGIFGYWLDDAYPVDGPANQYTGTLKINTGSGNDDVDLFRFGHDAGSRRVSLNLGSGNDTLAYSPSADIVGVINGASGTDSIDVFPRGDVDRFGTIRNFETITGLP
jgi:hypothetical protein